MRPPGLTQLYAEQARRSQERGTQPPFFAARRLEAASGNRLFYTGLDIFSGPGVRADETAEERRRLARAPARQDRRVRVHAARRRSELPRRRPSALPRGRARRRAHGRDTGGAAQRPGDAPRGAARDRARRRPDRDGRLRVVPVRAHHEARPAPREGRRRSGRGPLRHACARGAGEGRDRRSRRLVPPDDRAARRRPRSSSATS